jgi:hypothetical protein
MTGITVHGVKIDIFVKMKSAFEHLYCKLNSSSNRWYVCGVVQLTDNTEISMFSDFFVDRSEIDKYGLFDESKSEALCQS